jgi:hypothetical protein
MGMSDQALKEAIGIAYRHMCQHESRHRGGTIWEICDVCGARWADDRGGFKKDPDLERLESLEELVGKEPCAHIDNMRDFIAGFRDGIGGRTAVPKTKVLEMLEELVSMMERP